MFVKKNNTFLAKKLLKHLFINPTNVLFYLKNLMEDGKNPKWMNQWFEKGKVPPGYHVDHIKPLSVGGKDLPENMRLLDIDGHKTHHKFYRPWQNK